MGAMKVGTLIHPFRLAKRLLDPSTRGDVLAPLVAECVDLGANHIELTGEMFTLVPEDLLASLAQEIQEVLVPLKRRTAVSFSLHLPAMGGMDISSSIPAIRRASIDTHRKLVDLTRTLDPDSYVLHVAGMIFDLSNGVVTGNHAPAIEQLLLKNVYRSIEEILTFVPPRSLCLENLPSFPMEFLIPLVRDLPVSVCLDIGHLHLRGENLHDFWARFGSRTRQVHFHDVKTERQGPNVLFQQDHHALGHGNLDLDGILDTLSTGGFAGPLVLETLRDPAMTSIARLKGMLLSRGLFQQ